VHPPQEEEPDKIVIVCCFADGDLTGFDIDSGTIRLVRWPDNDGEPRPREPEESDLGDVFHRVSQKGSAVGLTSASTEPERREQ
jgi:hypothetical protein